MNEPTTHHFPLLPIQLQHGGQRASRGGSGGGSGSRGSKRFWSGTYCRTLTPQSRILVSLLVVAHVLQAWRGQGSQEERQWDHFSAQSTFNFGIKFCDKCFQDRVHSDYPPLVMLDPWLIAANKALRVSGPESPPPEDPPRSMGGGGGPGGGGGGAPPAGALVGAAEPEATGPWGGQKIRNAVFECHNRSQLICFDICA